MASAALPLVPIRVHVVQTAPLPAPCREWGLICWADAHPGVAGYLQATGALLLITVALYQSLGDHRRAVAEIRTFR